MTAASLAFDLAEVTRALQAVEPAARLVSPRRLRRVIRRHFDLASAARAPHDFCFEMPRQYMETLLGHPNAGPASETLLLLPLPGEDEQPTTAEFLLTCWRRLFHAAIDREVDKNGGGFADDRQPFNATVLHEIRTVLEGEHRLPPPENEHIVFREFAAFFLELRYFAPEQVASYFPGFLHPDAVARFLEERIAARPLFEKTRPAGAPDPGSIDEHEPPQMTAAAAGVADPAVLQALATQASKKGNDVRAAILLRQLGNSVEADASLRRLVERLRAPLRLDESQAASWYEALRPLQESASRGFWPVADRLLYELQKACLDVERKVYAVDVVEWAVSFGKKPVKRSLEKARDTNVLRRLRAALRYALRAQITSAQRTELRQLLSQAIHETEQRIRTTNRPILHEVLDEVGLIPANLAERIARNKLVEELLDTLVTRGFLKMSDLRDAIARNRLKLEDLTGPGEWFGGDPLIRANRLLALRVDGIYRRGEIYMRGLQRLTSLGFGTALGRLLVLWLILPFGAAFVMLKGTHYIGEELGSLYYLIAHQVFGAPKHHHEHGGGSPLTSPYTIGIVANFLIGLLHWPAFRRQAGIGARIVFVEVPSRLYHSPIVRGLFNNRATRFVARYLLIPLLAGGMAFTAMRLLHFDWAAAVFVGSGVALLISTFFRTPLGQGVEERLDELLARVWRVISVNFIVGLLVLILTFFRALFEWIERGMYAVDEWFRFREGESTASYAFKLVFGTLWFLFSYLFRFAWNLLIEPQINPIKHFPVVTVSHKLLLPLIPSLADAFGTTKATMGLMVSGIPGIFGFLVWECKENWKLYKANRSPVIGPVPVGSHGERVRGLLRPGFHSGVVPKQFAKLRKAETAGNHRKAAKLHQNIEHVAEAVHHLAERELIAYLNASQRWGGLLVHIENILLATNRLRIVLGIHDWEGVVVISIEERGGWLIGSFEETGWLGRLLDKQRAAFADALTALYKLAGVHITREQASVVLNIDKDRLDCRPDGLVVLSRGVEKETFIPYGDNPRPELVLSDCPVRWSDWIERWEEDQAGKTPAEPLAGGYRVVPNG
jgi:hypothetical protein